LGCRKTQVLIPFFLSGMTGLVSEIKEIVGESRLLLEEDLKERYDHIWHMDQGLDALAVVLPKSTQELSEIMKICHRHDQAVVVHGGLTNLVGGTETQADELVISLEKMNAIEEFDEGSRTLTVQAGAILEHVQNAAKERDLLFPLNFGAKGSAQLGGIISSNAGGLRVFRFGMTRNLVLGLEVVMADGTVISSLKKTIKDNSAYDLKHLFIGSEGTLGIVTRAVLKLVERPRSRCSAYLGIKDYDSVVKMLKFLDKGSAGKLSGYECIWPEAYKVMALKDDRKNPPIAFDYNYYVLCELLGGDQAQDFELLQKLLEQALEDGIIEDAALAHTDADLQWFWQIREDVHVLVKKMQYDQHFDISLPTPLIGAYVDDVYEELCAHNDIDWVFPFGHVADGNVHFIVGKKDDSDALRLWINDVVYNPLQSLKGSVSAEHGIGNHKKKYLPLSRSSEEIELMKTLKRTLDPKNILNRGKVLDP